MRFSKTYICKPRARYHAGTKVSQTGFFVFFFFFLAFKNVQWANRSNPQLEYKVESAKCCTDGIWKKHCERIDGASD